MALTCPNLLPWGTIQLYDLYLTWNKQSNQHMSLLIEEYRQPSVHPSGKVLLHDKGKTTAVTVQKYLL
jgi:hypothetical protein